MDHFSLLTVLGAVSAMVTIAAGVWVFIEWRTHKLRKQDEARIERFHLARYTFKNRRGELVDAALRIDQSNRLRSDLRVLCGQGWVLDEPRPLDHMELIWTDQEPSPSEKVSAALSHCERWWPKGQQDGTPTRGYHQALERFDKPGLFGDPEYSYRLLDVEVCEDRIRLTCCPCKYFDAVDTQEILGFELARSFAQDQPDSKLRYRKALGNPLELENRCALPAIATLTIRRSEQDIRFFMHKRDSQKVVNSPNTFHVAPAGEFEPSDVSPTAQRTDFDLWRTIMREYAEEFLNREEAYGTDGGWIDYVNDWPFSEMADARRNGELSVWTLGIILEPITWKPQILTVAIFDQETFDRIFGEMSSSNEEGKLIIGNRGNLGIPFDKQHVEEYTRYPNTHPVAQATLEMAWQHRTHMNLSVA